MDQLVNVLLAIDKAYTQHQRAQKCRPGLGKLNQVYGHNHPTPSTLIMVCITSLQGVQLGISLIAYWQLLPMLVKGKQTCHTKVSTIHTKQSLRYHVSRGETCCRTISEL